LREVKKVVDHVNKIETAFLHLLDEGPVKGSRPPEKIDAA